MCGNLADGPDFNQMAMVERPQVEEDNDESSGRDAEGDTTDGDMEI